MSNQINVTFSGDSSGLDRTLDHVSQGTRDASRHLDDAADSGAKFGRSVDDVSEGLGGSAGKLRATNDLISGFSDSVGLALPPQAGMIMGFADMADGLGELLGPALGAAKKAMAALNLTFLTSPIGLLIAGIAALTIGFVIAYKKSETFRKIVHNAMDGVREALGWVVDKGEQVWGFFRTLPGKIGGAFKGLAEIITAPYRLAFNGIASLWNNTVGRLSFSIPSWVPGIGGAGFDVPDIPTFANGGKLPGGIALVGERGPELVAGGAGAHVFTASQTRSMLGGGGTTTVVLDVRGGDAEFRRMVRAWAIAGGMRLA